MVGAEGRDKPDQALFFADTQADGENHEEVYEEN